MTGAFDCPQRHCMDTLLRSRQILLLHVQHHADLPFLRLDEPVEPWVPTPAHTMMHCSRVGWFVCARQQKNDSVCWIVGATAGFNVRTCERAQLAQVLAVKVAVRLALVRSDLWAASRNCAISLRVFKLAIAVDRRWGRSRKWSRLLGGYGYRVLHHVHDRLIPPKAECER